MQYTPPLPLEVLQGGSTPSDPSEFIQPLCTWQDVQDASKTNPDNVLKLLMSASDFDLAKDWAELHGVFDDYQQVYRHDNIWKWVCILRMQNLVCDIERLKQTSVLTFDICYDEFLYRYYHSLFVLFIPSWYLFKFPSYFIHNMLHKVLSKLLEQTWHFPWLYELILVLWYPVHVPETLFHVAVLCVLTER